MSTQGPRETPQHAHREWAADAPVWKNPENARRTEPSSHSTGGRKDHARPDEGDGA